MQKQITREGEGKGGKGRECEEVQAKGKAASGGRDKVGRQWGTGFRRVYGLGFRV